MVCHRELYERRPAEPRTTEFYLWMSLGGVLGGVFAALIAPQIFNAIWEFPLLLVARHGLPAGLSRRRSRIAELARRADRLSGHRPRCCCSPGAGYRGRRAAATTCASAC